MTEEPIPVMAMVQQSLYRAGIRSLLQTTSACDLIGLPTTVGEALELLHTCKPAVALLDMLCDHIDMLEMARLIRADFPDTAVILLTIWENDEWLFQAVKAGAAASPTRNITAEHLCEIIQRVSRGENLIDEVALARPYVASRLLQTFREQARGEGEKRVENRCPLTHREKEILEYIVQGMSNKEIASVLGRSDQTIKNHITSTLRKLDASDRTAAVVIALRQRWITFQDAHSEGA